MLSNYMLHKGIINNIMLLTISHYAPVPSLALLYTGTGYAVLCQNNCCVRMLNKLPLTSCFLGERCIANNS